VTRLRRVQSLAHATSLAAQPDGRSRSVVCTRPDIWRKAHPTGHVGDPVDPRLKIQSDVQIRLSRPGFHHRQFLR